ncbi:MAG: hypothetical protein JWO09_926 [Bacteroidetes bacterium]|nr:hypothetical protein [Bacteroidota bacterium]
MKQDKNIVLIGYSGHSFVVLETFRAMGRTVSAYCDLSEKEYNPYNLGYAGNETEAGVIEQLKAADCFVSIGDNQLRRKGYEKARGASLSIINAVHPSAIISETAGLGNGVMVAAGVIINAQSRIGNAVICNTGCIIEHECRIADFVHIAPGAVLCGNVSVGEGSFVGANSVIRQGITIGKNVIIGAGTVITKDIADGAKIAGNPPRML